MAHRYDEFAPGEIYHVFTRGVERRNIFLSDNERKRFQDLLTYYMSVKSSSYSTSVKLKRRFQKTASGKGLVDLLCFCLMDNHFHLLIKENQENGISTYMHRILNAYARYFNIRYQRSGSLFLRPFRAVLIDGDDQFLHVSRYIHLNPFVARMVQDPFDYRWSSLSDYLGKEKSRMCHTSTLRSVMGGEEYRKFVADEADYQRELGDYKHLLIDYDD